MLINPAQNVCTIIGYFSGFRTSKFMFWIVDEEGSEYQCIYDTDEIASVVQASRTNDKIEIKGRIVQLQEQQPVIEHVSSFRNLDLEERSLQEPDPVNIETSEEPKADKSKLRMDTLDISDDRFFDMINKELEDLPED